jgi:hypothetical protein
LRRHQLGYADFIFFAQSGFACGVNQNGFWRAPE